MPLPSFTIGTAGHIDHGKSALVRALTGIETDRLAEEQRRGITIDLGFAWIELDGRRAGIVDVPGHERFVRNMVAGAAGIDLALLVVAADDSVMPQTREHLDILRLLRVRRGVIAITKSDLVEPGWIEMVEQEITALTADTLPAAPIVRSSALTGAGIAELRTAIAHAARDLPPRPVEQRFRMPIDRAFARPGAGTIVTGTVAAGSLATEDELELLCARRPHAPGPRLLRVRALQSHGVAASRLAAGERAAINLAGIHHGDVRRGDVLAAPGLLLAARRVTVQLELLAGAPRPLRDRQRVRLHIGTQETMASVRLLEAGSLAPGGAAAAQLHAAEPIAAVNGQPFVIRAASPVRTIGGGIVIQPVGARIVRGDPAASARLAALGSDDDLARADAAAHGLGWRRWETGDLCRDAAVTPARAAALVDDMRGSRRLLALGDDRAPRLLHADRFDELRQRIEHLLRRLHERAPLEHAVPRSRLAARLAEVDDDLLHAILDRLVEEGVLAGDGAAVGLAAAAPRLSVAQRRLQRCVVEAFESARYAPPSADELARSAGVSARAVRPIIELCVGRGELEHLGGPLYLHRRWAAALPELLSPHLTGGAELTVSEIKTLLGTSRKYAVPICEHLDRRGVTRRVGDRRVAGGSPTTLAESTI